MKKVILFMHVSLDGFVQGPKGNGDIEYFIVDKEINDFASKRIQSCDAALYGRKTWQLMESYWPVAGNQPNASAHTKEHAKWYAGIDHYVLSRTIKSDPSKKLKVIGQDLVKEINDIRNGKGNEILIFGSPSTGHALQQLGLVDGYWLFVNPILIGSGTPLFDGQKATTKLRLVESHKFNSGVVSVSYDRIK
ncbi:MAG TPA: dihydrofolate reductase family protein [Cyclobacteriaceae bacterium]|nr:dihydrofolate reductase family protein [Cyclobacteriaceae bacterium]